MKNLKMTWPGMFCLSLIIASGFCRQASAQSKGKVLVVLTAAKSLDLQDGKSQPEPGYYLDELSYPLKGLLDAGFEPVFATPGGAKPNIDPYSEDKIFFGNSEQEVVAANALVSRFPGLTNPQKLSAIAGHEHDYVGVLVPGGFGPIQDLATDPDLGKILSGFHSQTKPTGMICHGPISLISTLPEADAFKAAMVSGDYARAQALAKGWIYAGYHLTVFAPSEELLVHHLNGKVTYIVSHALAQAGAHVDYMAQGANNVVTDRELVTGQQPFSAVDFTAAFVNKLKAYVAVR